MADWITVETKTLKSGKIKTTVIYLEGHAAEKRMWDYIKAANSPEEILQRTLQVYAAAAFFKRECGPNGKEPVNQLPLNATAREALEKIVKPLVPMSVRRIDREVREYDATKQAQAMIEEANAEVAGKTRGKGSASHEARAVDIIEQQPGITIPELATKLGVKQNYFYKALPALERDGKLIKKGRGWYPLAPSTPSPEAQADIAELPQAA
jgi:predicted DNA-binding transcriptional regulator